MTHYGCHDRRVYKGIHKDEIRNVFRVESYKMSECSTAWQREEDRGDRYKSSLGPHEMAHLWKLQVAKFNKRVESLGG